MKFPFLHYYKAGGILLLLSVAISGFGQNRTQEFTVSGMKVILHQTQKET
jgi:hypothetical protein